MRSSYVAFKTAIMNEIVQKQLYEGHQLRQLFRLGLELGVEMKSGGPQQCAASATACAAACNPYPKDLAPA